MKRWRKQEWLLFAIVALALTTVAALVEAACLTTANQPTSADLGWTAGILAGWWGSLAIAVSAVNDFAPKAGGTKGDR